MVESLAKIVPDISDQYSGSEMQGPYWQLKVRAMHAFQTTLMLKALAGLRRKRLTVVDIGDSAGTHMIYLTKLAGEGIELETISVNLDPKAVEKISAKGLKAILCRAECLNLGPESLLTSLLRLKWWSIFITRRSFSAAWPKNLRAN